MELRRFQQFVTLVEEGSFTAAADRLHMAQSSLSASIAVLERELGVQLVTRSRDGVTPTDAGTAFLEPARSVVAGAERAKEAAILLRPSLRPLRVADTFATVELDAERAADAMREDWPTLPIEITHYGLRNVSYQVAAGEVDVAVTPITYPLPEGVDYIPLGETPIAVLCSTSHRLAQASNIGPADLAGEVLIRQPEGSALRGVLIDGLGDEAETPLVQVTASSWINAISLARRGYGLATGPQYFTQYYPPDVAVVTLASPPVMQSAIVIPTETQHPALNDYLRIYRGTATTAV